MLDEIFLETLAIGFPQVGFVKCDGNQMSLVFLLFFFCFVFGVVDFGTWRVGEPEATRGRTHTQPKIVRPIAAYKIHARFRRALLVQINSAGAILIISSNKTTIWRVETSWRYYPDWKRVGTRCNKHLMILYPATASLFPRTLQAQGQNLLRNHSCERGVGRSHPQSTEEEQVHRL